MLYLGRFTVFCLAALTDFFSRFSSPESFASLSVVPPSNCVPSEGTECQHQLPRKVPAVYCVPAGWKNWLTFELSRKLRILMDSQAQTPNFDGHTQTHTHVIAHPVSTFIPGEAHSGSPQLPIMCTGKSSTPSYTCRHIHCTHMYIVCHKCTCVHAR